MIIDVANKSCASVRMTTESNNNVYFHLLQMSMAPDINAKLGSRAHDKKLVFVTQKISGLFLLNIITFCDSLITTRCSHNDNYIFVPSNIFISSALYNKNT